MTNLVNEIEAAAARATSPCSTPGPWDAHTIATSKYWPRIKAALEVGEKMADMLEAEHNYDESMRLVEGFRAAAGEGS